MLIINAVETGWGRIGKNQCMKKGDNRSTNKRTIWYFKLIRSSIG